MFSLLCSSLNWSLTFEEIGDVEKSNSFELETKRDRVEKRKLAMQDW